MAEKIEPISIDITGEAAEYVQARAAQIGTSEDSVVLNSVGLMIDLEKILADGSTLLLAGPKRRWHERREVSIVHLDY